MPDLSTIRKRVVTLTSSSSIINEAQAVVPADNAKPSSGPDIVLSAGRPVLSEDVEMPSLSVRAPSLTKLRMSEDAVVPANADEKTEAAAVEPVDFRAVRSAGENNVGRFFTKGVEQGFQTPALETGRIQKWLKAGAMFISATWVGLCLSYVTTSMGWGNLFALPPHIMGGVLTGMIAPLALLWISMAFYQRKSDMQLYAEALRSELHSMIFPSDDGVRVLRQEMEDLVRQAAELSGASNTVLKSIHRTRTGLRSEMQSMLGISKKTESNIDELSNGLEERKTKLMQLLMDIEERTANIDGKALAETKAWDEASKAMQLRANEIEHLLGEGAVKLKAAAEDAEEKAGAITGRFSGLDEAASKAAAEADRLESALQARIDALEILAKKAGKALSQADASQGQGRLGLRIAEGKAKAGGLKRRR